MSEHFDCIVIGFGGVGSQALRFAAMQGWKTLGLDRFGPAHDRGSSHGQTRIIRRAYFEHPSYVPLTQRAFDMWDELNKRHRTSIEIKELLTPIGLLQIGHRDSQVIEGVAQSASQHQLRVEKFSAEEIEKRLPIFNIPNEYIGLYEPDAGFLRVELCVAAAINQASKAGATITSNVHVQRWSVADSGVVSVETDQGVFTGDRLIITCGAWTTDLLGGVIPGIDVVQKQQYWFQLDRVDQKVENNFPAFLLEQADGSCFYGIPEIDYLGMKVCEHSGGEVLSHPSKISREINKQEFARTETFMKTYLRHGYHRMVHFSSCMYSMSIDGHFYVDRHPQFDNVVFAAGLSGHGFKFAPVVGKRLVDILQGKPDEDFEFLKLAGRV